MITTPVTPLVEPVPRRTASKPGHDAWRYRSSPRSRWVLSLAIAVSVGVHVGVLFGFNRHAPVVKHVVQDDTPTVALVMPDLKELDEPEPVPRDSNEPPPDPGLSVPTLADVPTSVDLSDAFVQQIDYSTLTPQQDLSAAKAISIPTHINRGSGGGSGLGTVFNLADLDRNPEPLVRVAPQVPPMLKREGFTGKAQVGFIVTAQGDVVNPYIISSSDVHLDDSALIAISKWKFRPGVKAGRKVNVRMVQPFLYNVNDNS